MLENVRLDLPEPGVLALSALALGAMAVTRRRRPAGAGAAAD